MTKSTRDPISVQRRFQLLAREGFTCAYCGAKPGNERLNIDHMIPHSCGGSDHDNNLITACDRCNNGKSNQVAVPASLCTGERTNDGWRVWKRWGLWVLIVDDGDHCVLSFQPDGRDYWIPLDRIHEEDWHEHIRDKDFVMDPDYVALRTRIEHQLQRRHESAGGSPALTLAEFFARDHLVEKQCGHPKLGQSWLDFLDGIAFSRTLMRRTRRR